MSAEKKEMHEKIIESKNYYDRHAKTFDKSLDGFFSSPFKAMIARKIPLKAQDVILDVGCANGKLLTMLQKKQPDISGAGIDISSEMISLAEHALPQMSFVCGNAENLPFRDDTFDWVICSASFHHFPNPQAFLLEAKRVLKKGGTLLLAEIHFPKIGVPLYNQYIKKFNKEGDVRIYTPQKLRELLKEAGFSVDEPVKYFLQVQLHTAQKGGVNT